MLNLPSEVNVCGLRFRVEQPERLNGDSGDLLGQFTYPSGPISVPRFIGGEAMSDSERAAAFYHELLHGLFHANAVLLSAIPEDIRETWIDAFAVHWADTVQRNGLCALSGGDGDIAMLKKRFLDESQ